MNPEIAPTGGPIYSDGSGTQTCVVCRNIIQNGQEYFCEIEGNYHVACAIEGE